jgi:dienelactone hydrolase
VLRAVRLAIAAALLHHAALAGAQEELPLSVVTEVVELAGQPAKVDVYRPDGFEPIGVAVLAHGFTRDRTRNRDLGRALALAGVVAVAPDLPHASDGWANANAIGDLVQHLERGGLGLAPAPRSNIVLMGTSAGGLATVIAAADLPGLAGWVGLDPVDQGGVGAGAAAKLAVPAVVLLGDPSVCNLFGSGRSFAQAAPTLIRSERLRGASHCDFEGPTNTFCRTVCGRSARGMAESVRSEAVSAVLMMFDRARDDPAHVPDRSSGTDALRAPSLPDR